MRINYKLSSLNNISINTKKKKFSILVVATCRAKKKVFISSSDDLCFQEEKLILESYRILNLT